MHRRGPGGIKLRRARVVPAAMDRASEVEMHPHAGAERAEAGGLLLGVLRAAAFVLAPRPGAPDGGVPADPHPLHREPVHAQPQLGAERTELDAGTQGVIVLPTVEATACQYGGEYPFCRSAPNPDGGMDPGTEPPPGEGGGDPTAPTGSSFTEGDCPADRDPNCKKPLGDADKESLASALQRIDRNAAPVCAQLADKLAELGTAHVFRGAYDSGHTGQAGSGDIHVDPRFWNAANEFGGSSIAALADALLHETAHLLGWVHPGETRTPYRTFPFDHMFNPNAGVPQCVR